MHKVVKKVVVLGSGTAGLVAAASLRKTVPDISVTVLRSKDIPIIGVGEGTTLSVTDFLHDYLKVPSAQFFDIARPTWKLGIRFNWGPRKAFYYPFVSSVDAYVPGVPHPIGFYCHDQLDYVDPWSALMAHDKAFPRGPHGAPMMAGRKFAYHFENERLVDYLERYTAAAGVATMEGTVVDVRRDEFGVTGLVLKTGDIVEADLFIDSSGFVSTLLGQAMQEPFVSFKSTLFCDRAVVGGWDRTGEPIKPYTTCDTLTAGWSWRIEHETRINRGYVFSSEFISDEAADAEFRKLNPKVTSTRIVKFRSGRYRNMWAGNVVAIGNAGGFVEPLEATAIGAICMQSRLLAEALLESGGRILKSHVNLYNNQCARNWDSIRTFLAVHYKYNTLIDTPFWRAIWNDCDLAGAEPIVDYYRETGPTSYWKNLVDPLDFAGVSGYFTMLAGQNVPHDVTYEATPPQRLLVDKVLAMHRAQAAAGLSVEETLRIIRDPRWQWAA
jgi:tryptophan halogenase